MHRPPEQPGASRPPEQPGASPPAALSPGSGQQAPGWQGPTQSPGIGQREVGAEPTGQGQGAAPARQAAPTSGPAERCFPSRSFLDEDVRARSVAALNRVLADLVVLHSHAKTAHWNVRGPDFYQLHELFDDVAGILEGHVDGVAERATALGGIAAGDVHDAVQRTTLGPFPPALVEGNGLLDRVAADVAAVDETLYRELRRAEERGDLDTADLLNEVSRDVSKALWFVEAHRQGPAAPATPAAAAGVAPGGGST